MKSRTGIFMASVVALTALTVPTSSAKDVVQMHVPGYYYTEPATLLIRILVEPDERNRVLRLEADGETFFRSTEESLEGASEKRVHLIQLRNLPSGQYTVRAQVLSADSVRGTVAQQLTVMGR